MALNVGSYLGFAKETTYGTRVAPVVFAPLLKPAKPKLNVPMVNVPNTLNFGDISTVPGIRNTELSGIDIAINPETALVALAALIGTPAAPTGTNPNLTYTLTPSPTAVYPSYSMETRDGNGCFGYTGSRLTSFDLSHTPEGFLQGSLAGVGRDRASQTAASPTLTNEFFQQSGLVISYNSVDISALVEDFKLSLRFGKELYKGFGAATIANVGSEGTGEAMITLRLRYDSDRNADFIAATPRALTATWTINANRSLAFSFANVVLTDDPIQQQNDALGEGRIQLVLRALANPSLFTATVKTALLATNV
jgi:hypothetical protein